MNIFDNAKKIKFHLIDNAGTSKTVTGQITFDEKIVALTKMYRLEYKGSNLEPKPVRIW